MRIVLPSGTPAEIDVSVHNPTMGLVIAPDIFGLRPLFEEMVANLALQWRMSVIAVEPFAGRTLSDDVGERFAAMASLDDETHLRDLEDAADVLGIDRVGLMGFCMGGMYCFKSARSSRFAKIASFYGMIHVPQDWASTSQGEPLQHLYSGNPEKVLAIIGSQDPYTPPDHVTELFESGVTVLEYPNAVHGFAHDPSRPAHRSIDAADAFARTQEWLLAE